MSGAPSRARTTIEAVLPHFPHGRCPRSRRRHRSQIRWPVPSRLAAGLTSPQCAQAIRTRRAAHGLHMAPASVRVSGAPARPQQAQAGVASEAGPRAISSATSRPVTGGAPAARAPGSAASAAARLRKAAGWPATAVIAAWT
ncbi:MAG: hypothetical protein ACRDNT_12750 [Streptosporangiaceae bacterium]